MIVKMDEPGRAIVLEKLRRELTGIAWSDMTWNLWHGCSKVDTECFFCYAEVQSERYGRKIWGATADRWFLSDKNNEKPIRWNRVAAAHDTTVRVFVGSMMDWAEIHSDPETAYRMDQVRFKWMFPTVEATPNIEWLFLTKRPENIVKVVPERWLTGGFPKNMRVGTSVGYQGSAEKRIPVLLTVPGLDPSRTFLSVEPMVDWVDLGRWLFLTAGSTAGPFYDWQGKIRPEYGRGGVGGQAITAIPSGDIGWVLIGGESGPLNPRPGFSRVARRMDPDWVKYLMAQCGEARVPVFFKQTGTVLAKEMGLRHPKGEDPTEWPAWMQVQQFPDAA